MLRVPSIIPLLSAESVAPSTIPKKLLESEGFKNFLETYNTSIVLVLGIITILLIILFFVNVSKLSASANNQFRRREAINGIFVCLVCLAIIGSLDAVYAILVSFVFSA